MTLLFSKIISATTKLSLNSHDQFLTKSFTINRSTYLKATIQKKMFPRKLDSLKKHVESDGEFVSEYQITDSGYGKDNVKLLHIERNGTVHNIKEFEVNTHLKLYSKKDYLNGNCNMQILLCFMGCEKMSRFFYGVRLVNCIQIE